MTDLISELRQFHWHDWVVIIGIMAMTGFGCWGWLHSMMH